MSDIYNSIEYNKMLMETVERGKYIYTYVWTARYAVPPYENSWYRTAADKDRPIRMIRREKYDPATGVHDYSYPNLDTDFLYVWSQRESYDYDNKSWAADWVIMLNDTDILVTEQLQYIWLEAE